MKNIFKTLAVFSLILTFSFFAFAQDIANPDSLEQKALSEDNLLSVSEKDEAAVSSAETITKSESVKEEDLEWVWGDVVSVDAEKGQFTAKYLDYETDTEKEIAFYIDEKTVFENAHNLGEIRPQDSASVDYAITNEGKNVARLISVEKNISDSEAITPLQ